MITDPVQQWLYFFCRADESSAKELAERLPDPVFAEATRVLEMAIKIPDVNRFYNMRLKMERDERARNLQALEEGLEKGEIIGSVQLLQEFNGLARQSTAEISQSPSEELAALEHELTVRYHVRREAANGGVGSPVDPPCRPADFP